MTTTPQPDDPEPIAIVGMACRLPDGCRSPELLWNKSRAPWCATGRLTDARRRLGMDDADIPGGLRAGWLEDIDRFDHEFFGISPREAVQIDPQHRIFLQVAIEALDAAGQPWHELRGCRAGVYLGIYSNEYTWLGAHSKSMVDVHTASGAGPVLAANRLSYLLDLRGPSLAIDTTCSSSLVATHLAAKALRSGEIDLAIVGGVNLIVSPQVAASVHKAIPIAPDGRCKAFSAHADGTVRAEGCVVFVLKRASDARRANDRIDALILGSAVNQDGRSNGLTAPNPAAQTAVIKAALADANVSPDDVEYLEAHGAGTELGDAIELEAAAEALREGGRPHGPCRVGTIKANVGHLEAAAGAAGLLRAALIARHGLVPEYPLVGEPHPALESITDVLELPREPTVLRRPGAAIGVSAFSLGGTNAHVVLQRPSTQPPPTRATSSRGPYLVPICARSPTALNRRIHDLGAMLREHRELDISALSTTTCKRGTRHPYRKTFVAETVDELRQEIEFHETVGLDESQVRRAASQLRVAFVFPGHGAQWPGMAERLMDTEPRFRAAIERMDVKMQPWLDGSLRDLLCGGADAATMADCVHGQPALIAVELALAELLMSWGVRPSALVGYSAGELPAMVLGGMLTEEEALELVVRRAASLEDVDEGGMYGVNLGELAARTLLRELGGSLALAAVTSPENTVISGRRPDLLRLQGACEERDVLCRDSGVPYLFHHPQTLRGTAAVPRPERLCEPKLPVYSSVVGGRITRASVLEPEYWRRASSATLRFDRAIESMLEAGIHTFVEVGPTPSLTIDIRATLATRGSSGRAVPTLRRHRDARHHVATAVATLFDAGCSVDLAALGRPSGHFVRLPPYPWAEPSHWWPDPDPAITSSPAEPEFQNPDAEAARGIAYEVRWERSELSPREPLDRAHLDAELQALCGELADHHPIDDYAMIEPRVDAICAAYAARALMSVGVAFEAGTSVELGNILGERRANRTQVRMLERVCEMLEVEGWLRRRADGWEVTRPLPPLDPRLELDQLSAEHPEQADLLGVLGDCADHLGEVLAGDVDPLHLLFPDGRAERAAALFSDTAISKVTNALVVRAVERLVERWPTGRPFRILEIGAGTGGTTVPLLEALEQDRVSYCCTDISPTLLRFVASQCAGRPHVDVKVLDISRDPVSQGFTAGRYELVVAANVLHATPILRDSLRHARELLADGGVLVLLEATRPQRYVDLTFGLTRDWHAYEDTDIRDRSPLVDVERWVALAREVGLEPTATIPADPLLADRLDMALMVFEAAGRSLPHVDGRWLLVVDDEVTVARAVGGGLEARGASYHIATADRVASVLGQESWTGVIDLRCLSIRTDESQPSGEILGALSRLHTGLLDMLQAPRLDERAAPRLVVATRGAFDVERRGPPPDPVQAALVGTLASLSAEQPEWSPRVIDCGLATPNAAADAVLDELVVVGSDPWVARRGGHRWIPRLVRAKTQARCAEPYRARAE
ncbi:MAG: acyltransferase domain-containing protein, partial [Deltaproteobacteria bacterium]|nr:acyltransferase domain-containing protein [Deltaproteobacteria bacterium]